MTLVMLGHSFKVGTFKNWRMKRKSASVTVYDQCWNNTIDYSMHQSTLEDAIGAYFAQTDFYLMVYHWWKPSKDCVSSRCQRRCQFV